MANNNSAKIWQWAVGLLVLCNVGLLLTIWLKPHHGGPPHRESPRDFVVRSLGFSKEQEQKYDALVTSHQQAMRGLRDKANEYREALFSGFDKQGAADSLSRLIGDNQKEIEKVTYDHFAQVRALCTESQKKEFDHIIGDVTKRMNGGPHPPHGHGPPGHDGPPPGEGPPPHPPGGPENP